MKVLILYVLFIVSVSVIRYTLIWNDHENKYNKVTLLWYLIINSNIIVSISLIIRFLMSAGGFSNLNFWLIFINFFITLLLVIMLLKFKRIEIVNYKNTKEEKKKIDKKNIFEIFFILLNIFIITVIFNFLDLYSQVPVEQLAFHLQVPITGASNSIVLEFLKKPLIILAISFILILLFIKLYKSINKKTNAILFLNSKNNLKLKIYPIEIKRKTLNITIIFISILCAINLFQKIDIKEFIFNQFIESSFISDNYVNYDTSNIIFPEKKRNLIYIYLESMESTFSENDYIPFLKNIALENVDLSFNNKFYQITGTSWTIASMVAQTSGLPLKFSMQSESYNTKSNSFLNGITTLGEILKTNGYKNYLYLGSDSSFASRDLYFNNHGEYEIFDYYSAAERGYFDPTYSVWWGYEDRKLFEYSKIKLTELSKLQEPFNFTLLTADTHAPDGYLDEKCTSPYENELANVIRCSDEMVYEFVKWIMEQEFYENSTIVITGDHLYMGNNDILSKDRYVYATIINPGNKQDRIGENREFSAVDMFPTTLAALGIKINDDKLGLGVNLFSDKKTLIESYGYEYVNEELKKKSTFYYDMNLYK